MLHLDDPVIREYLLEGKFGLEKEGLRVTGDGRLAHTPHPFAESKEIVRDFCENQTEINTPALGSAQDAVDRLRHLTDVIHTTLAAQNPEEYLWPFSNAPVIDGEEDIPIAQFAGEETAKTDYRKYLSGRYGRYKMTFSGIHVNYSFHERLLRREAQLEGEEIHSFTNRFYVELAEKASAYGWLLTVLTAASPIQDISYVIQRESRRDLFAGMASVRCSELGYWNHFSPVLDYTDHKKYADSIERYVQRKLIISPTELYYPIRLKPKGVNSLDTLRKAGVNHIELRMFDLNPLRYEGIDVRDVIFAQLFLVFLASLERRRMTELWQVQAVQNFKNAAHYDLEASQIVLPEGRSGSVREVSLYLLRQIEAFYKEADEETREVIQYQIEKVVHPEVRYAAIVREKYQDSFVEKGLKLAKTQQVEARNFSGVS